MTAKTEIEIPQKWEQIRSTIEGILETPVIIAGGALRDLDNGRPVYDVDMFYHARTFHYCEEMFGRLSDHFRREMRCRFVAEARVDISGMGYLHIDGEEYNLIGLRFPCTNESVTERIDFGICQIAWDGDTLYKSEVYNEDKEHHTFTITLLRGEDRKDLPRVMERYHRLQEKYPEWELRYEDPMQAPYSTRNSSRGESLSEYTDI